MTDRLAKTVVVDYSTGTVSIDGEALPYLIGENLKVYVGSPSEGVHTVTISVLTKSVTVVLPDATDE